MVQPWCVKIMKFAENSPLLARTNAQNRKFASLTRIAPWKWLVETDFRWARRVILWHSGQIWKVACREQCVGFYEKNWKWSGLTNSFWTGVILHQTSYAWLGLCKTSAWSIGGEKSLGSSKVWTMHTWHFQKSWNFIKNCVFQGARASKSANSLRWRESPPRSDS